jgi:SH3 domain-containing YSC84-like protein 1
VLGYAGSGLAGAGTIPRGRFARPTMPDPHFGYRPAVRRDESRTTDTAMKQQRQMGYHKCSPGAPKVLPMLATLVLAAAACSCRHAALVNKITNPGSPELKLIVRLDESAAVFDQIMSSVDQGVPRDILDRAACVVIIPSMQTYSLIVGAEWGSGFVSCRKKKRVGWSAPGAVSLKGGSFGLQVGSQETNLLLLIMNRSAESRLLGNNFTIGLDASAAAGPVGRSVGAETNASLNAEILSWSQSSGLFAGISLQGATLRQDDSALKVMYDREITNRNAVEGQTRIPKIAQNLVHVLDRYSRRAAR